MVGPGEYMANMGRCLGQTHLSAGPHLDPHLAGQVTPPLHELLCLQSTAQPHALPQATLPLQEP